MSMGTWEPRKLTDLADYINGYGFAPEDWGTEGLPIIRIEQLKNPNAPADYYAGKLPEKNIIDDGDLIFSWSASLFLRIWKNGKAALNQHLFKVVEKLEIDREFLKSFIEFYLPELTKASHGSTMQHITRKELEKFSARFPIDKTEQKGIAFVIATLDRAIEQTDTLIAKQHRIKTGLMQDLLTKGIDEHGNIRSEATHAFKDSLLGRIPVEWEVGPMSAFQLPGRAFIKTGPFGSSLNTKHWVEDGVPVITIGSLGESGFLKQELLYVSELTAHALSPYRVKPGDIVFSRVADIGRALVITAEQNGWIISSNFMRISLNESKVSPSFLYHSIVFNPVTRNQLRVLSNASGREVVNTAILSALHFAWPDLDEQNRINDKLDQIDGAISKGRRSLEKIVSLKRGLMYDLLTGERRVTLLLAQAAP